MKPKKHRRVVAKKEHICKECKNSIAKEEICVQGGSDYYHDDCYSALKLMLEEVYHAPKLTETVAKKLTIELYLERTS
jgi:hypothetical protein